MMGPMRMNACCKITLSCLLASTLAAGSAHAAPRKKKSKGNGKTNQTAPAASAPAAPAPPPPPEEPEVPKKLVTPIQCVVPDETAPNTEVIVRCAIRGDVKPASVKLSYRGPGTEDFVTEIMQKSDKGWWTATIPASAVQGKAIQYFVEAQNNGGDVLAANGRNDSPNVLYILAPATQPGALGTGGEETSPLAGPAPTPIGARRRPLRSWWIGAGVGWGYGWHRSGETEYYNNLPSVDSGFAAAGLLHIAPEVGFQLTDQWAFSIQGRHQIIPEDGDDPQRTGHPANGANSFLFKGHYTFAGEIRRFFATGIFGVGEGFRLGFGPDADRGTATNDTIRGGPVLVGPGGGFLWDFSDKLSWVVEANLLVGVPDVAAVLDLQTGLQLKL